MILRHTRAAIFLHWFNAVCWIFLLLSGLALLAGPVQPIGSWWHEAWHGIFSKEGLLWAHLAVGCVWIIVYAIAIALWHRSLVWPFLRGVFRFSPRSDLNWCVKKGLSLTIGEKKMQACGIDPAMPPQGFYNAGQRLVAVLAVVSSIGLAITGLFLAFGNGIHYHAMQIFLVIHFVFAAIMAIFLPVHIYMAALAPGEGPALRSMFTGFVPKSFAAHHNSLWHEELQKSGRIL